jgi:hypothetical protein
MSEKSVDESQQEKLGDVSWLFLQMTAAFSNEWLKRYPPKKTRVVKNAKLEWGRVIGGYSREEIQAALDQAKHQSTLPPSTTEFWKLLAGRRMRNRRIAEQAKQKAPPDRKKGVSALENMHERVGQ